jgi:peptide/nickel transport system ATP-binding protein
MTLELAAERQDTASSRTPVLDIADLSIAYREHGRDARVVHSVSLSVASGEVVALVGESGSGKSTTAQAVIGLLAENGRIEAGRILINGLDVTGWTDRRFNTIRGKVVSLIPQDPGASLNPVQTIGKQVGEVFRLAGRRDEATIRKEVLALFERVGLSEPDLRYGQYPHELSGGMKQRVLIAIAIALKPRLIIADEPTSALDVTVQQRILDLIDDLRREIGTAVLLVTHDLGVAADRADRIVVLRHGRVQESGPTAAVLSNPHADYTRQLLADAPALAGGNFRPAPQAGETVVSVAGLIKDFRLADGRRFRAVDDIGFSVPAGTTHAIVGESGSGKTTAIRTLVGFEQPTAGAVSVLGQSLSGLRSKGLRRLRRTIQLVHQNPFSSLDPLQTVAQIIEEPLLNFTAVPRAERQARVRQTLENVGLPAELLSRRPRALSGGQRQRVAIARALVLEPKVLVLDEAVSALDVTVQAQILRLLVELQERLGLAYVFVTHDLAVVRQIAHTVTVMQAGRAVEAGPVREVFVHPRSPYTRDLIAAIPGQARSTATRQEQSS